jgi:hydrogenase maturation protease
VSELASEPSAQRVLVAGIGNTFLSDDGFGVEVIARLRNRELPEHVELVDTGIRGMHLAYQLLDGYDVLVLVDAVSRGSDPGTLYVLEHDLDAPHASAFDPHGMDPAAVLAQLDGLAAAMGLEQRPVGRVLVVGCEPASLEEGMGLSAAVAAAVGPAVDTVTTLVTQLPEGVRG